MAFDENKLLPVNIVLICATAFIWSKIVPLWLVIPAVLFLFVIALDNLTGQYVCPLAVILLVGLGANPNVKDRITYFFQNFKIGFLPAKFSFLSLLLHMAVLLAGSVLFSILYEAAAGNRQFSLPLMNFILVPVVGGILSIWFGWISTGIILGIYGACMIIGGFAEG
jgi:hypothetical protein